MASPMQAEDVEWGERPPCQIELDPPLIFENPSWPNDPSQALAITVGDCIYIVEYYKATTQFWGGYAFYIAGIYESTIGNPNPCNIPREELYKAAMVEIIKNNIYAMAGADPEQGVVTTFLIGSCVVDLSFPDEPSPIPVFIKFKKPASQIFDFPAEYDPNQPYFNYNDIQGLTQDDISSNDWNLPIRGGYMTCDNAPCCFATYLVNISNEYGETNVESMYRTSEPYYPENFECLGVFWGFGENNYNCIPNCDALFESYNPIHEFYDMKIYPSPADGHIYLELPMLQTDLYEVQIVYYTGDVVFIFTMTLSELSYLDLTPYQLNPGQWRIRIIKDGRVIATTGFIKN